MNNAGKTPANTYEAMLIQHGRMQMLSEITEQDFPLTNTRLVNLLSKFKKRQWKVFSRRQKEICVKACGNKRDDGTLEIAFKIARQV